jgi:hypothetical protein
VVAIADWDAQARRDLLDLYRRRIGGPGRCQPDQRLPLLQRPGFYGHALGYDRADQRAQH